MNTSISKKVIVITINYNQAQMTIECVNSVLESIYDNFQIFLIDNGSEENDYFKLVKAYNQESKVDILRLENNCGYVGGVNHGLKNASELNPDYFLIMNNDTIIDKSAITALVDIGGEYNQNAIISGKVYHFNKPNKLQYIGGSLQDRRYLKMYNPGQHEIDRGQYDSIEERDMLDDIMWLLPRKIFNSIGYYSTYFFLYGEQADYARRAIKNGYKLIYTPKAKIWHKGSITTGDGDKSKPAIHFWRNKGAVVYLYRNTKKRYFYVFLSQTLSKYVIKNTFIFLKKGGYIRNSKEFASLLGLLYGIKWVLIKNEDNGFNPFLK